MSLLANVSVDDNVQNETDSVGSGGVWESDLYPVTIDMAYLEKKQSGAVFLNVVLKDDNGRENREGLCILSGDKKGNKNYYENKQGERHYLPGFNVARSLALLTTGKELDKLATDVKTIKVYNFEAKKDMPTDVEVVEDLLGQRVVAGVLKKIVDKNQKGDDGQYHPTGETREINEIDKIFRERDMMTVNEILAQETEAAFHNTWKDKFAGKTINRASAANDANGASQGAPKAAAGGGVAKPKTSLFS